jgi:hypothetical protein
MYISACIVLNYNKFLRVYLCQAWWYILVILAFGRWWEEDPKFEVRLGNKEFQQSYATQQDPVPKDQGLGM